MSSFWQRRTLLVFGFMVALLASPIRPIAKNTVPPTVDYSPAESCPFAAPGMIMWSPAEIECPVCKTKNIFMVWDSYGSYIYKLPSKYQLVFWPFTDGQSWYSCKKCRYTNFMQSFPNVPKEKIAEMQKMLEGVTLPAQVPRPGDAGMFMPPYLDIPVSQRLKVVEKVQRLLGEKDDYYWNHFYRVLAFHLELEKKQTEADEARRKSLEISERMLADPGNANRRKELLYIAGAMRHFLKDDAAALKDFEEAEKLTFSSKDGKPEQDKNYDQYLASVTKEYIQMLHKKKRP